MIKGRSVVAFALIVLGALSAQESGAQIISSKRGFADTGANYNNLQATGASWYYTWGGGAANPGSFDAKFYPMFWNSPNQASLDSAKAKNPAYVLGFNEPERTDQANMTVAQAISSWTTITNAFAGTSTLLVSPAVADTGGTTGGQAWLSSFMSQAAANNLRVDAVAFHWYGVSTPDNPAGAAAGFLSRVDSYHNSYNKPVFITEFAIHDWGGAYTDAQIIEANRQFLDIVIPGLESRSYVAGYSWYNWFSDSPLYSGSPATPTQMGYSYVGALKTGTVTNIGGQNLGEHVAYLNGGEVTMTGMAGTLRYINALANKSTISGTLDWALSGTNWTRVQPGATLQKSGTNQITLGGTVTNNGTIQVNQGTLRLNAPMGGNGTVRVKAGTLALTGTGGLANSPLIDVSAGGTLDVSAVGNTMNISSGRTFNNDGTYTGNASGTTGATISGGGVFNLNLTANAGATVRVGKDGGGVASRYIIDNFESYAVGDLATVASPPWTAHQATTQADIESYNGNKVMTFGWAGGARGVSRTLADNTTITNDKTATVFFRINSKTDDPDHSIGLSDQATTSTVDFNEFETQLRLKQGTATGTFALDARNGGAFSATLSSGLALNTWYNIWMVVNQTTDKYDLYMNTGNGAATTANKLNSVPLSFRNGTTGDLNYILGFANTAPIDNGVRVDDFVYQSGTDLTNPSVTFDPGLSWTAETMTVKGNYTQNANSTLQMNLFSPAQHDVLHVNGQASLAGTLNLTFAVGAPAAHIGDKYQLLEAGSMVGGFTTLQLPTLSGPLAWDSSLLNSAGSLSIFSGLPGDFTQDGLLNSADLQKMLSALTDLSKFEIDSALSDFSLLAFGDLNHDGQITNADIQPLLDLLSGAGSLAAVPEPATMLLFTIGALPILVRSRLLRRTKKIAA
jgi:hypothetical protein